MLVDFKIFEEMEWTKMSEDVIEIYKRNCTIYGQFDILYNNWVIFATIAVLSGIIDYHVYKYLHNTINEILLIYVLEIVIAIVEIAYFSITGYYVFSRQKTYTIAKFKELISDEKDEEIKNRAQTKMKEIKETDFTMKYLVKSNQVDKIYNIIRFEEFMIESNINSSNKAKKIQKEINEYIKDKDTYTYFKLTFLGVSATIIMTQIIEYAQAVYFPTNSTVFEWEKILLFLLTIGPFIMFLVIGEYIYKKMRYLNKLREKRTLKNLSNKLNDFDFNQNKLERYMDNA